MFYTSAFEGKAITSCKDCKDRTIGCHSNCERYLNDKKIREESKKQIANEVAIRDYEINLALDNRESHNKSKKFKYTRKRRNK